MNILATIASEPHKYGIGIVGGLIIYFTVSKVLSFLDRRLD